jgi:mono/diheme cytochrome c family protein
MRNSLFATLLVVSLFTACHENPYKQGKILYENFCSNCHMDDGTGLAGVIPPLAGADFLNNQPQKLPCIIYKGMDGEVVVNGKIYNAEMPGSPKLTEFEITNIINYINRAWGNDIPVVQHETVRKALKACNYR